MHVYNDARGSMAFKSKVNVGSEAVGAAAAAARLDEGGFLLKEEEGDDAVVTATPAPVAAVDGAVSEPPSESNLEMQSINAILSAWSMKERQKGRTHCHFITDVQNVWKEVYIPYYTVSIVFFIPYL